MNADSFTSLWKQVDVAKEKDLPQSEIKILKIIANKAEAEGSYGNLLAAEFYQAKLQTCISRDSMDSEIAKLEIKEQKAEEHNAVLAAVYQAALAKIYRDRPYSTRNEGRLFNTKSDEYLKKALSNPSLLASVKDAAYTPFVKIGTDSKLFYNDLLHVIGLENSEYKILHDYYVNNGNRHAACICACLMMQHDDDLIMEFDKKSKKSKYLQKIDSLINEYNDLPEAGELAIEHYSTISEQDDAKPEDLINYISYALNHWGAWPRMNILRNAQMRLTIPSFQVSLDDCILPDKPNEVRILSALNINNLTMNVYRINVNGDTQLHLDNSADYNKLKPLLQSEPVYTETKQYIGLPAYKDVRDTMTIKGLPVGCYMIEFTTNNKDIKVERTLLRVSNIYTIRENLPNGLMRIAIVNATTGEPIPYAKIDLKDNNYNTIETLTTDSKGELIYNKTKEDAYSIFAYTEKDTYSKASAFYYIENYAFNDVENTNDVEKVFTDRKIYRPGQMVHATVWAYKSTNNISTKASIGKMTTLTLCDANGKNIAEKKVITDEFGSASADFVLPSSGLTGEFTIRSKESYTDFNVEEYKRPTFQAEFEKYKDKYANGDSIKVKGIAKTFSGVPVQNAKITYTIERNPSIFWQWGNKYHSERIADGSATTDENGVFYIPFKISMPENEKNDNGEIRYYTFSINADVTNQSGETRQCNTSLPLSDKSTILSADIPEKIEKDSMLNILFHYNNNAGEPIDGKVRFTIDGKNEIEIEANKNSQFPISKLNIHSGEHILNAACGTDTLTHKFITFSLEDEKTPIKTSDWYYVSNDKFALNGNPVYVQIGNSDPYQHVVYSIFSGNKCIKSGSFDQCYSMKTFRFDYKPEYGNGILITYAWVHDGQMYQHSTTIERELPNKELTLTWKTFRDRLTPGQKETWTLNIKTHDGKAAKAQLLSVLFDKSLDMIKKHDWNFHPYIYVNLPRTAWEGTNFYPSNIYGEMAVRSLDVKPFDFSSIEEEYIDWNSYDFTRNIVYSKGMVGTSLAKPLLSRFSSNNKLFCCCALSEIGPADNSDKSSKYSQIRKNMNETAFYYPDLTTDKNGDVNISFTLPESVTTWRFMGLAHDKDMNYGSIDGEAIAKKTVMIQPNMPRFLRSGDAGQISALVSNSSEKAVKGIAKMEVINPETQQVITSENMNFALEAGKSNNVAFNIDASKLPVLSIIRITANGKNFSDGEQHYLPVLQNEELVTNTLPFTINEKGLKEFDLSTLFSTKNSKKQKLTIEYTNNPAWLMIQALPSMATPKFDDAISLTAAYYANSIGNYLLKQNPTIKTTIELWQKEKGSETSMMSNLEKNQDVKNIILNETPWMADADKESEQKQQLINFFDENSINQRLSTQLSKLQKLQRTDGSFSWWPDMQGSKYMTTTILEMLVRLNNMIGKTAETKDIIDNAYSFMDNAMADEVKDMKKEAKETGKETHPGELATQYLYINALDNRNVDRRYLSDQNYLLKMMKNHATEMTIYGKANAAVIFGKNTHKDADFIQLAKDNLQSISEYSVYKEDMGRYFDTKKAYYSWFDYRIPTQVAAIEAWQILKAADKKTITEMQRWLLQEKHTQVWDTPLNSVNAVYAFLNGGKYDLSSSPMAELAIDGKKIDTSDATAGLGYIKTTVESPDMKKLSINKQNEGTSWGAAYGQFLQKSSDIDASSHGLIITREILKDDQPATGLKVGDKIIVRITVTADRDYDFVQISDKRAACMEPFEQLSGYHWGIGNGFSGYYCAPLDNATNYFFDQFTKGKHIIETTYYIDRPGCYDAGTCTVQCAYAPEYSGRATGTQLNIK